ncbi:nicotinamide-nucleotide amidohydrolase family protein [Vibrio vulnificus]|nr:nicotinamide-nucleotide amidohydrolase family protein [Vibrio vulnificus]
MNLDTTVKNIHETLTDHGLTVSVAESLTSGMIQSALANPSGASVSYSGGITAYSLEAKVSLLGVDRAEAESCNCVSSLVAAQMAEGVMNAFGSDIGLATTGYAESYNEIEAHAFIAIAIKGHETEVVRIDLKPQPNRTEAREHTTSLILTTLHTKLISLYPTTEIELKFLPSETFCLNEIKKIATKVDEIKQAYLAKSYGFASRIRLLNNTQAFSTTKFGKNIEIEFETPFPQSFAIYSAIKSSGTGFVEKTRYTIPFGDLKIEVDVFEGRHLGLVYIEIEVPYEGYRLEGLPHWMQSQPSDLKSNAALSFE